MWPRVTKITFQNIKKSILNNKANTGYSEHCITQNHFFYFNSIKLLHSQNKGKWMDLQEILEINKSVRNKDTLTNGTNGQTDFYTLLILKALI